MEIYIQVCAHVYVPIYVHVCTRIYAFIYMHVCTHFCTQVTERVHTERHRTEVLKGHARAEALSNMLLFN